MKVVNTRSDVINCIKWHSDSVIGLVPTMGALHEGHVSLIHEAKKRCDIVVVSIFVNPNQFAPNEDFDDYPRTTETDLEICKIAGVDVVFLPSIEEIYPDSDPMESYRPSAHLTSVLCGVSRPHFFQGVCDIVVRLFNIIQPRYAFFGDKDLQQRVIIEQMVNDLDISVIIIACPIIRDANGLALSSRNQYLSKESYAKALMLPAVLKEIRHQFQKGDAAIAQLKILAKERIETHEMKIDYVDFFHPKKQLILTDQLDDDSYCCMAVFCDDVRLIDNCSMKKQF